MLLSLRRTHRLSRSARIALGAVWIAASCGGLAWLASYAASPGASHSAPAHWPVDSSIALGEHHATLLFFAHPHCPCTRASLGELEKIAARCQGLVTVWVVFFVPAGSGQSWDETDLVTTAAAISAAHIVRDTAGIEARRFGVATSGQTLLYSDGGDLLFSGGITSARGHAGDNAGGSAIESLLTGQGATVEQTPVYGCPISVTPDGSED